MHLRSVIAACILATSAPLLSGQPCDDFLVSLSYIEICSPSDTVNIGPVITGGEGSLTYLWHDGGTDSLRQFTGLLPGDTLSITVTDENGCEVAAQVTVKSILNAWIDYVTVCSGELYEGPVDIDVNGGTPPYVYSWDEDLEFPAAPGVYSVTVTDAEGCIGIFALCITEVEPPSIELLYEGPICEEEWTGNVLDLILESPDVVFCTWWSVDATFFVECGNIEGCMAMIAFELIVHPAPYINPGGEVFFCPDELASGVEINIAIGPDIIAYETSVNWDGPPFLVYEPGEYSIAVTNAYGCMAGAVWQVDEIQDAIAAFDYSVQQGEAVFTNMSLNSGTYLWHFGDGTQESTEHPVHTYESSGTYTVQLIAFNECGADTATVEVEIIITSVDDPFANAVIQVYPNPNDGMFFVRVGTMQWDFGITILDMFGRQIERFSVQKDSSVDNLISVRGVPQGVYTVVLSSGEARKAVPVAVLPD